MAGGLTVDALTVGGWRDVLTLVGLWRAGTERHQTPLVRRLMDLAWGVENEQFESSRVELGLLLFTKNL